MEAFLGADNRRRSLTIPPAMIGEARRNCRQLRTRPRNVSVEATCVSLVSMPRVSRRQTVPTSCQATKVSKYRQGESLILSVSAHIGQRLAKIVPVSGVPLIPIKKKALWRPPNVDREPCVWKACHMYDIWASMPEPLV